MVLTRSFRETVKERVDRDPEYRAALLQEGIELLLAGEVDAGRALVRDYINATIGFGELGRRLDKSPKSLMRMFGPAGNPQASNLFAIIRCLQDREAIRLEVRATRADEAVAAG